MQIYHDPEKYKFGRKCVALGHVLGRFIEYTCVGMRERYREVAPPHTSIRPVRNICAWPTLNIWLRLFRLSSSCASTLIALIAFKA